MSTATIATIVKLDPAAVRKLIDEAPSQGVFLVGLYRMVHPDFDAIAKFESYPTCSPATWEAIFHLVRAYDDRANEKRPFDKQIFPGGVWMNSGFSTNADLGLALWEVQPATKIVYLTT